MTQTQECAVASPQNAMASASERDSFPDASTSSWRALNLKPRVCFSAKPPAFLQMDGSMIDGDSSDQKPVLHGISVPSLALCQRSWAELTFKRCSPPPPQPKVECCLLPKSTCRYDVVRRNLDKYLHDTSTQVFPHTEIKDYDDSPFLRENVEFIKIYEARGNILFHPWTWFFESSGENLNSRFTHPSSPWPHGQLGFTCQGNSSDIVSLASVTLQIHVYQLSEEDSVDEYGEEDAEVSTANNWILPSRGLDGVWDRYVSVFMVCLKKTPPDR